MTVSVLPDSARLTSYTLETATTGPLNVSFNIWHDDDDYAQWLEVWDDGVKLTAVTDWTLDSPSGSLATLARPITDARITFTSSRTGSIKIVGATRPRRTTQFTGGAAIPADDHNRALSNLMAIAREQWDLRGRTLKVPPGEDVGTLPPADERTGRVLIGDDDGTITVGDYVGGPEGQYTAAGPDAQPMPYLLKVRQLIDLRDYKTAAMNAAGTTTDARAILQAAIAFHLAENTNGFVEFRHRGPLYTTKGTTNLSDIVPGQDMPPDFELSIDSARNVVFDFRDTDWSMEGGIGFAATRSLGIHFMGPGRMVSRVNPTVAENDQTSALMLAFCADSCLEGGDFGVDNGATAFHRTRQLFKSFGSSIVGGRSRYSTYPACYVTHNDITNNSFLTDWADKFSRNRIANTVTRNAQYNSIFAEDECDIEGNECHDLQTDQGGIHIGTNFGRGGVIRENRIYESADLATMAAAGKFIDGIGAYTSGIFIPLAGLNDHYDIIKNRIYGCHRGISVTAAANTRVLENDIFEYGNNAISVFARAIADSVDQNNDPADLLLDVKGFRVEGNYIGRRTIPNLADGPAGWRDAAIQIGVAINDDAGWYVVGPDAVGDPNQPITMCDGLVTNNTIDMGGANPPDDPINAHGLMPNVVIERNRIVSDGVAQPESSGMRHFQFGLLERADAGATLKYMPWRGRYADIDNREYTIPEEGISLTVADWVVGASEQFKLAILTSELNGGLLNAGEGEGGDTLRLELWDVANGYEVDEVHGYPRLSAGTFGVTALREEELRRRVVIGTVRVVSEAIPSDADVINGLDEDIGLAAAALAAHEADTTSIHGITDTAQLALRNAANTFSAAQTFAQQVLRTGVISPSQITSSPTNNYNPTGLSTASIVNLDTDGDYLITGLTAQTAGTEITFFYTGNFSLTFLHESGSSTAANRFDFASGKNIRIVKGDAITLRYSSTATRWRITSLGRAVAPSGINHLDNPGVDIWQDQTSVAATAATGGVHLADRWKGYHGNVNAVFSRQAGFSGAEYCIRMHRNVGNASASTIRIAQQIPSAVARTLAGKLISVSVDARTGANFSGAGVNITVFYGTGADETYSFATTSFPTGASNSGSLPLSPTVGATEARMSNTLTVPSGTTEIMLQFAYTPSGTAGANDYLEITNFKLEVGPIITPFEKPSLAEVWEKVRRFFRKSFRVATAPAQNAGAGTGEYRMHATIAGANVNHLGTVHFGVSMRIAPTITLYNPEAANAQVRDQTAGADCTVSTANNIGEESFALIATGAAGTTVGGVLAVHWTADARF